METEKKCSTNILLMLNENNFHFETT